MIARSGRRVEDVQGGMSGGKRKGDIRKDQPFCLYLYVSRVKEGRGGMCGGVVSVLEVLLTDAKWPRLAVVLLYREKIAPQLETLAGHRQIRDSEQPGPVSAESGKSG